MPSTAGNEERQEIQEATYVVEDDLHPATADLPRRWRRLDEHYSFRRNPRPLVNAS